MSVSIRQFISADKENIWNVHLAAVIAEGFSQTVAELDFDYDIEGTYLESGGDFVVATVLGKLVGMGGLKRIRPQIGEISRMRVHPEYQRSGIGSRILASLETSALRLGMQTLRLDTANHKVRGFYELHGYLLVKQESEGELDYLFFEKNLV